MYQSFLSWRFLTARRINWVGIIGVFVGVTALILILSIMSGFLDQQRRMVRGTLSHIVIEPSPLPHIDGEPLPESASPLLSAVLEDERVEACAVVGVPDDRLGERVAAWVQVAPGKSLDPAELIEHCRSRLARYKVPERIALIDEMPRNAMNKIVRRSLPPIELGS